MSPTAKAVLTTSFFSPPEGLGGSGNKEVCLKERGRGGRNQCAKNWSTCLRRPWMDHCVCYRVATAAMSGGQSIADALLSLDFEHLFEITGWQKNAPNAIVSKHVDFKASTFFAKRMGKERK